MKLKLLILLFISIISFSCSSDDSSDAPQTDNIVGTWGIFEYLEEYGGIKEVDPRLTENQFIFRSDGTLSSERFDGSGNWKNIGNRNYEVATEGEKLVLELLNNDILKGEYGNGEATFMEKVKD